MIEKLNEKALLQASETAYRAAVIRKINQLVAAVSTGVVWENKVDADRKNINSEQAITEQDILNIENGIALTELELMVLEMGV